MTHLLNSIACPWLAKGWPSATLLGPALLAGLLAAVLVTGIYAAAATSASTLAAKFTTAETVRHAHAVKFQAALTRASAGRDGCMPFAPADGRYCTASANASEKSANKGDT